MSTLGTWAKRIAVTFAALLGLVTLVILALQNFSDGPTGPLTGGPFSTGEVRALPVGNIATIQGDFEFELVGPGTSRTAGGVLVGDQLYITCDLGFIWNRLPPSTFRTMLNVIWWFKDWHEVAQEDGRIRIRQNGNIYEANISLVTDPEEIEQVKVALETLAAPIFPDGLPARPENPPNDILFFRIAE